jgi:hypothetical protein
MNLTKILVLACLFLGVTISTTAQSFLAPFEGFSTKKTTYITMQDGSEQEGQLKNLKRKKGLITEIFLKTDGQKKPLRILADDIKNMYVPASGLAKLNNSLEKSFDATEWKSDGIEQERMKDGYAYFEFSEVLYKKETRKLLLQLLNPGFSTGIRVYHDPFAGETMSAGVGGIRVAGGDEKSYYVKKGDQKAYRLKKKEYNEEFTRLFKDCMEVIKSVEGDPRWSDFAKHAYAYAGCKSE